MNKIRLSGIATSIEGLSKGFWSYSFGVADERGEKSSGLRRISCVYDERQCMYPLFHGSGSNIEN